MTQLQFKLEQHTPLLHFQHTQQGATLRATEVKPRFDRWLVTKVWNHKFDKCKTFLVGYDPNDPECMQKTNMQLKQKFDDGYCALNYKMRIEPDTLLDVRMDRIEAESNRIPICHKLLGEQMYTTESYPSSTQSVIMSNIGGRLPEEVFNFSLHDYVYVHLLVKNDDLEKVLQDNFKDFVLSVNFGNRKSKGFGSFMVVGNNDSKVDLDNLELKAARWSISFTLKNIPHSVSMSDAYKDIFSIINKLWKQLKRHNQDGNNSTKAVLLGKNRRDIREPKRLPSPMTFKPIIRKDRGVWKVLVAVIYEDEIISAACTTDAVVSYDKYMEELQVYLNQINLREFSQSTRLKYSLDELSINLICNTQQ